MALHKNLLGEGKELPECKIHSHKVDETWTILQGRGSGYWIDENGNREEFDLEAGDVWLIPAGYEHGSDGIGESGKNSDDFRIAVHFGGE